MAAKFRIGVIAADHAKAAHDHGICAFSHVRESAVAKLSPDDRASNAGLCQGARR